MAIPLKSLRLEPPAGADDIRMGIGFKRNIPRKNEEVFGPFVPNDSICYRPSALGTLREVTNRLYGGARISGRQGRTAIGAMNLQVAGDGRVPVGNFTVRRVKQDVLARFSVGAMFSNVQGGGAFNLVAGAEASYYVKRVWFFDASGASVSTSDGGSHPGGQYHVTGRGACITDTQARVDTREREVRVDFETGDGASLAVINQLERLTEPFRLRQGFVIAPGTYTWNEAVVKWDSFRRRHLQLDAGHTRGGSFDGTRDLLSAAFGWRCATTSPSSRCCNTTATSSSSATRTTTRWAPGHRGSDRSPSS